MIIIVGRQVEGLPSFGASHNRYAASVVLLTYITKNASTLVLKIQRVGCGGGGGGGRDGDGTVLWVEAAAATTGKAAAAVVAGRG